MSSHDRHKEPHRNEGSMKKRTQLLLEALFCRASYAAAYCAVLTALALTLWSLPAQGTESAEPTLSPSPAESLPIMSVGARIELILASEYEFDVAGFGGEVDGAFGAGFGFMFDYRVWDYIKVGPDLVFATVKVERADDRDTLLNIGGRVTGFYPFFNLGPISTLLPYGFMTMGLSFYIPDADQADEETGFWIQAGAGAELIFGSFGAFSEFSVQGNINDDYSYTGFQFTLGGKYYF